MTPNPVSTEQLFRLDVVGVPLPRTRAEQASNGTSVRYELRFRSLFDQGRGYAFPCDVVGRVEIDALGDQIRDNFFYARACVGREFFAPVVLAADLH